jgi:DNA-binding transcriptional regulator YdaS (Cro superfamily)
MNPTNTDLIQRAIDLAGGQTALAGLCGVKQPSVANWLRRNNVSAKMAIAIERAMRGQITREQLRPDIFCEPPAPLRQATDKPRRKERAYG